jgi:hypothetical protein
MCKNVVIDIMRKLFFLPSKYTENIVNDINVYFDKGYEVEKILNADDGYYVLLVLKNNGCNLYTQVSKSDSDKRLYDLIEERSIIERCGNNLPN